MNTIKSIIFFSVVLILVACSSTSSDIHQIIEVTDRSSIQGVKLEIDAQGVQLTSQTSSSIFTLHHSLEELKSLAELVALRYGFDVVDTATLESVESSEPENDFESKEALTGFYLKILSATPDGGVCIEGFSAAAKNISYTSSVLTFGLLPASIEHCLVLKSELYRYQDNELELIGEFNTSLGRVEAFAGANEVDNYQLTVEKRDETRGLEVSLGDLFNTMLIEEAFEQKRNGYFEF